MPALSTVAWAAFGDAFSDFYGRQLDRIVKSLDQADAQIVNEFLCEVSTYLDEKAEAEQQAEDEKDEAEQQAEDEKANEKRGGKRANAGQKPFGLTANESQKVKSIQGFRKQGMTFSAIAKKLNDLGWRTKTRKKWKAQTVKNVLLRYPVK